MSFTPSGCAMAMVSFDASSGTPTVGSAFNATVTDDGVGLYSINFVIGAASAEYVAVGNARHTTTTGAVWRDVRYRRDTIAAKFVGGVSIQVAATLSAALADAPEISVTIYGVPQ